MVGCVVREGRADGGERCLAWQIGFLEAMYV